MPPKKKVNFKEDPKKKTKKEEEEEFETDESLEEEAENTEDEEENVEEEEGEEEEEEKEEKEVKVVKEKEKPVKIVADKENVENKSREEPRISTPLKMFDPKPIHQSNEPRLMIKYITLTNFKSYAGVKKIGPFHHRFSSVVGPNGSGKSNLIDALLFVFGYRTKKLRLNKISELIHNSNHGRGLASASVEIHFQQVIDINIEEGIYEVVPNSEFSVSRNATADNKSNYFINGQKENYTNVRNLLKEHHIDLDNNRFLILQGEVELISQMKPKAPTPHDDGLLEYIEDIIGSSRLITEIDKAVEVLQEISEKRVQQFNRVKAVEKAKESLDGPRQEAEEYLKIECSILDKQATLCQLNTAGSKSKVTKLMAEKESIDKNLQEIKDEIQSHSSSLKETEEAYEKKKGEYEKISKQMNKTKEEFNQFERKLEKLKQEMKHHKTKANSLDKSIEKDQKKAKESERSLSIAEQEINKATQNLENLTVEKEKEDLALEKIQASIKDKTADFRDEIEKLKTKMIPKKKKVDDIQSKKKIAESELKLLEEKANAAQTQLENAYRALENAKQRVKDATFKISVNNKDIEEAESRKPDTDGELNEKKNELAQLQKEQRELHGKIEDAKLQAQEGKTRSAILQAFIQLKHERGLEIYGRLGDLGAIDSKYDVAISTACGALDNIVVDTTKTAQICVNYLKQHNLGTATFIMLDQQEELKNVMYRMRGKTPCDRLFDLIRPKDERFLPAFYYGVRDTLVADTLDLCRKYSRDSNNRRYRVVSLNGEILDQSGTLTGGGNRVFKGGMKSSLSDSISKDELAKIEKKFQLTSSAIAQIQQEILHLEEESGILESTITRCNLENSKLQMDIKAMEQHQKELAVQIPDLEKKISKSKISSEDQGRIQLLQNEIEELEGPLQKALRETKEIEDEIQVLQKQIMEVGGMPLKIQQAKVDSVESQIDEANKAITRSKVQIKTLKKTIEKLTKEIEKSQVDLEEEIKGFETKKQERSELRNQAKDVSEKYQIAQDTLNQTNEELEGFKQKYEKVKQRVSKLRSSEVDLANQLETINENIKQYSSSLEGTEQQLKELENKKASLFDDESEKKPLLLLSDDELAECDPKDIKKSISKLQDKMKQMNPNMGAIAEYRKKHREFIEKTEELEKLTLQREEQQKVCEQLRKKRLDEFMAGFSVINMKLKEMYRMITLEGDAELEFVDSIDPFGDGIVFSVRPPKKSWKNIANLSGGEKTLSSLALVFALHHYKPTPLYFMDEIDAALDYKNVSIVAHYIKERTKNAQFIIISLRNNMFELADRLVGIYKPDNCTQSIAINPNDYVLPAIPGGSK